MSSFGKYTQKTTQKVENVDNIYNGEQICEI